jgi:hypothetical protein
MEPIQKIDTHKYLLNQGSNQNAFIWQMFGCQKNDKKY